MQEKLWKFTDNCATFVSSSADKIKTLYFPLANEGIMSSLSPDLHGDIKTGQDSFLLEPVSRVDLVNSKSSRNFWVYLDKDKIWSLTGVSKDRKQISQDRFSLKAGLLWHKIERANQRIGLKAEILSFVPAGGEPLEIMQVEITNISGRSIEFIPTAAIPIYARGAANLRDHRQVTSLLERISLDKFGVIAKPTLSFDEAGHKPNNKFYFVLGCGPGARPAQYIYPTQEMFCGEAGDLEAPETILKNLLPSKGSIQGREAMGALRFDKIRLSPGKSCSYIILLGISEKKEEIRELFNKFNSAAKVLAALKSTKAHWIKAVKQIDLSSADSDFDNWFRWVNIQPGLRRIFGCSFLPDFDYGKGGRGWRDLWQDCLGLILNNPGQVRKILVNNLSGVRIDGSNATIIGKKGGEFISDRNNISRVWMDHGVWPLISIDLYINETGDLDILFEQAPYFCDQHIWRSTKINRGWNTGQGVKLKTISGRVYQGSLYEHLLLQNLVQFFNVGPHNHIRLEGADWNDGLDMAKEHGESVAFSAMYAYDLNCLAELLLKSGQRAIELAEELKILLRKIDYNKAEAKLEVLNAYFDKTKSAVSGKKLKLDTQALAENLREKSQWIAGHIRKQEWLKEGFFNGYYDNASQRVEGKKGKLAKMMLSSQVFPIMSGVAEAKQVSQILQNVNKYLFDKQFKGFQLNTDFKEEQNHLGRAFSFVYGDKENGAFFNHMAVMFAYALYQRGFAKEAWGVLNSIYQMAANTAVSKIYPCLPEYFNLQGRGMYSYLTGSASWFMLTLLTESFGVKASDGNLLLEPKLTLGQFKDSSAISISRNFAGRQIKVIFSNPKKLEYPQYKIVKASLNSQKLQLKEPLRLLISRKTILNLGLAKINTFHIVLG